MYHLVKGDRCWDRQHLNPLNDSVWRKGDDRTLWRRIIDTATLQSKGTPLKKKKNLEAHSHPPFSFVFSSAVSVWSMPALLQEFVWCSQFIHSSSTVSIDFVPSPIQRLAQRDVGVITAWWSYIFSIHWSQEPWNNFMARYTDRLGITRTSKMTNN